MRPRRTRRVEAKEGRKAKDMSVCRKVKRPLPAVFVVCFVYFEGVYVCRILFINLFVPMWMGLEIVAAVFLCEF